MIKLKDHLNLLLIFGLLVSLKKLVEELAAQLIIL